MMGPRRREFRGWKRCREGYMLTKKTFPGEKYFSRLTRGGKPGEGELAGGSGHIRTRSLERMSSRADRPTRTTPSSIVSTGNDHLANSINPAGASSAT